MLSKLVIAVTIPTLLALPTIGHADQSGVGAWNLLGIETSLRYGDYDGEDSLDVRESLQAGDIEFALNFSNGLLSENQPRWIVSPFLSLDAFGEADVAALSTDGPGGRLAQWELGVRLEQERYINESWSWTWGGQIGYIERSDKNIYSDASVNIVRPGHGYRAGLHVGANTRVSKNTVITSRLGYDFVELNEDGPQSVNGTPITGPLADQDTELDGFNLSIGFRYEF